MEPGVIAGLGLVFAATGVVTAMRTWLWDLTPSGKRAGYWLSAIALGVAAALEVVAAATTWL